MSKEDDNIPFVERWKKRMANLTGQPYIYLNTKFNASKGLMEVNFDYNNAMLNRIIEAGYALDDDEPDQIVMRYIQHTMAANGHMLDDDYEEDQDEDDDDPQYIYDR